MKKIGLLNGPNLDRLGKRETSVYGSRTLSEIEVLASERAKNLGLSLDIFQSNHEGVLIDKIHEWTDTDFDGLIINPGGLTHTSVVLRDAIVASKLTTVEIHISNIHAREEFRQKSMISSVVNAVVAGMGIYGYLLAIDYLEKSLSTP